jgi:hypothetical protein
MNPSNLEVKTIVTLIAEGHIKGDVAIELIAKSCEIDVEKLSSVVRVLGKPKSVSTRWAIAEDAQLIKLWNEGKSASQIAEVLRRTPSAVSQRVSNLRSAGHNVPFHPGPAAKKTDNRVASKKR